MDRSQNTTYSPDTDENLVQLKYTSIGAAAGIFLRKQVNIKDSNMNILVARPLSAAQIFTIILRALSSFMKHLS